MASIAKGITLSLGLISTTVRVESAVEAAPTFKTVCEGQGGKAHDPTPIKRPNTCATCGELPFGAPTAKAREVGGGLVLVTEEEVAAAKAQHDDKFKGKFDLVAHKASEVDAATAQGEKYYQLVPEGDAARYAVLAALITACPDLAFVAMFTVRTRAAMFRLTVRNGVLLAEERVTRERLKPLPQIDAELNTQLLEMAMAYVPTTVTAFDVANYADGYLAQINALVASRDAVAAATPLATVTPIRQSDEDLLAQLAALVPAQAKAPAKPRTTRKRKEPAA